MKLPRKWVAFKKLTPKKQISEFIKFLKRNPFKSYDFQDNRGCAIVQFGNSILGKYSKFRCSSGGSEINLRNGIDFLDRINFDKDGVIELILGEERFFGKVAARLISIKNHL